jgi:hypothetical protein
VGESAAGVVASTIVPDTVTAGVSVGTVTGLLTAAVVTLVVIAGVVTLVVTASVVTFVPIDGTDTDGAVGEMVAAGVETVGSAGADATAGTRATK